MQGLLKEPEYFIDVDTFTDEENACYRGIEICSFFDELAALD